MITANGLTKRYGAKLALAGVSFEVGKGTIMALLGPNGAGKTTTVSCLTTLERPDAGRAVVAGCDVLADPAGVRARISLTGQFTALDPVLTGRQNLVMFGELLGLRRRQAKARAEEMLAELDLTDAADRSVKSYSGGMRRRLDLCVSLLADRPVLFLDEPTVGLDPRGRRQIWQRMAGLREQGTTIVLTTQHLEEADALADDIFVIDGGRVIVHSTFGPLILLAYFWSSGFIPVEAFPGVLQPVVRANPVSAVQSAMMNLAQGGGLARPVTYAVCSTAGISLVFAVAARRLFAAPVGRPRGRAPGLSARELGGGKSV